MRHHLLPALVLTAMLIAACTSAPAPAGTTDPAAAPTTAPVQPAAPTPAATVPPAPTLGPTPDIQKVLNPQPEDWSIGAEDAAVTIIEWSDFQCPFCAQVAPGLRRLVAEYPDDVRLIYRHFPLPSHDKSQITAQAADAAGAQGKFWEMNELLFEKQAEWSAQSTTEIRATLRAYAEQLGLDVAQFEADLDSGKYAAKVAAALDQAQQLGIPGTPFLLVNQQPWPQDLSYLSYNNLQGIVKFFVELPKMQFDAAPEMTVDTAKSYTATIKTDKGDVVVKLFVDKAPVAVNNFIFLAREGWYDNVPFHRVIEGFVAQAGDPSGLGFGGPGYTFDNEVSGLSFDKAGLLAMANAGLGPDGKGTNGSQFFITLAPTPQLDAGDPKTEANYTIFGEVIEGLEVVRQFPVRDPQSAPDVAPAIIQTVTIEEN